MKACVLWKRRLVNDLSVCRQLKLKLLSTQINICCLANDQSNACAAGTKRSVNVSCNDAMTVPLFFSPPPPSLTSPRAIIPGARPLGKLKIKIAVTVRRGISKRSHEKIGDCEQSMIRVKRPPFFVFITKTTQPRLQVFSVNGSLTCTNAAFLTSFPR